MIDGESSGAGATTAIGAAHLRVVMFGTPTFAVPVLEQLAADERFEVVLVVTQPDRPAGRGRRLEPSALKLAGLRLDLPLYQPPSLRDPAARQPLADAEADLFLVAAFGLVFGSKTLALPRLGCVNLHASLLPRYRGASPIAAAILGGDPETGVSLMVMELGLDTGQVIATVSTPIADDDTTASLTGRLGNLGADLAVDALPRFARGELIPHPQPLAGASLSRPLTKSDGEIDWRLSAGELARRVRAFWPWPRAWTTASSGLLQLHAVRPVALPRDEAPGLVLTEDQLTVACGCGALQITRAQPAGRRAMTGREVLAGRLILPGERLATPTDSETTPIVVAV